MRFSAGNNLTDSRFESLELLLHFQVLLQSPSKTVSSPTPAAAAVAPSMAGGGQSGGGAVTPVTVQGVPSLPNVLTPEQEQALLAGQPPGTQIKAITAQVIQTPQGPRIVLQGLTGSDFTPQQLAIVQQQVKQQLLKGNKFFIGYVLLCLNSFCYENLMIHWSFKCNQWFHFISKANC